uniref:Uncharacterized protein n=1 Tax=Arundo donax TaxID=35708 RepID=A0A0A9C3R1_ARUDO
MLKYKPRNQSFMKLCLSSEHAVTNLCHC